jgi:hypothetical protein
LHLLATLVDLADREKRHSTNWKVSHIKLGIYSIMRNPSLPLLRRSEQLSRRSLRPLVTGFTPAVPRPLSREEVVGLVDSRKKGAATRPEQLKLLQEALNQTKTMIAGISEQIINDTKIHQEFSASKSSAALSYHHSCTHSISRRVRRSRGRTTYRNNLCCPRRRDFGSSCLH